MLDVQTSIRPDKQLAIACRTDLPPGTVIDWEVRMKNTRTLFALPLGKGQVEGNVTVKPDGGCSAVVPLRGAFVPGKLEVWVAFQTMLIQNKHLFGRFGADGGKLTGSNVVKSGQGKRVEVIRFVTYR